ncbi:MAG: hypothetical protein LUD69_02655 [Oscillospiraceae bacterium]|nr:hypothetical protein [Oscillospiraceae bacterium]
MFTVGGLAKGWRKEILRRREGLDLGGVRAPLYSLANGDMPQVERCAAMEKWVS